MKRQKFALLLVLALVFVFAMGIQTSPAQATPPEDLNFVTTVVFDVRTKPSVSGDWTATGLIDSSGNLVVDYFNAGWNDAGLWLRSSHTTEVFTDSHGSFTIEAQITNISGRSPISGSGHWVIKNGTGAYENLRGGGSVNIYGELITFPYLTIWSEYVGIGHFD